MKTIGLTGSIGMGKSTTAKMFRNAGAGVFDSDAAVHALYAPGGAAVPILRAVFPDVIDARGGIDRGRLATHMQADPLQLKVLESFIHPLVGKMRAEAIASAKAEDRPVMVFDIPLLFETGAEQHFDIIVVVSAPADIQAKRVLARPGMSAEKFAMIKSRQMPDAEKRARADFVIDTSKGLDFAREQVQNIIEILTE